MASLSRSNTLNRTQYSKSARVYGRPAETHGLWVKAQNEDAVFILSKGIENVLDLLRFLKLDSPAQFSHCAVYRMNLLTHKNETVSHGSALKHLPPGTKQSPYHLLVPAVPTKSISIQETFLDDDGELVDSGTTRIYHVTAETFKDIFLREAEYFADIETNLSVRTFDDVQECAVYSQKRSKRILNLERWRQNMSEALEKEIVEAVKTAIGSRLIELPQKIYGKINDSSTVNVEWDGVLFDKTGKRIFVIETKTKLRETVLDAVLHRFKLFKEFAKASSQPEYQEIDFDSVTIECFVAASIFPESLKLYAESLKFHTVTITGSRFVANIHSNPCKY